MTDAPRLGSVTPPGKWASMALTVFVHIGLIVFLLVGVRWESHPPATLEVALVSAPAPSAATQTTPEPKHTPKPKPKPKPEPEPEPEPELKPEPKPDIAVKPPEPKHEPKPKPKPEPEPKPKPKPEPEPEPVTVARDDYMAQRLSQELERAQIERLMRDDAHNMNAAQAQAGLRDYQSRIAAKVRGNLMRPPGLDGNPEAVFLVRQYPDGTVVSVSLSRSSGIIALDNAIDRAIRRSSPLPLPSQQEFFRAELELRFRPNEE